MNLSLEIFGITLEINLTAGTPTEYSDRDSPDRPNYTDGTMGSTTLSDRESSDNRVGEIDDPGWVEPAHPEIEPRRFRAGFNC